MTSKPDDTTLDDEGELLVDDEYRLADGIEIVRTEGGLAIVNVRRRQVDELPYETIGLLQRLMDWTTLSDVLAAAGAPSDDAPDGAANTEVDLAATIDLIDRLAQLGALASRRDDLSGRRLDPPGEGWQVAQAFLRATRTTMATQFVNSFEIADDLAAKAAVSRQPSAFYERVDAPFTDLPPPNRGKRRAKSGFEDVLLRRRTARRFDGGSMAASDLSDLLHLTWGATAMVDNPLGDHFLRKTSPSGGALHTIEVYPIVLNVADVAPGSYHYSVRRHGLELVSDIDPSTWIASACGDQEWIAEAAVVFFCTSFLPRMSWKYDYSRAFRAIMAESGYTSQTAFLVAAWLGLGCFTTLALRDELVERMLGLDHEREPVLLATGVGVLERDVDDHSRPRSESEAGPSPM